LKQDHVAADDSSDKYLVFQLNNELYATPLVEIREVVEYQNAKPVPHMPPYFKGVINVRGEIIGVVDLRERLNVLSSAAPLCQLVFETNLGPLAAIVDRVQSVATIAPEDVDRRPSTTGGAEDRAYFLGVGKVGVNLVTMVSLPKLLVAPENFNLT